MDVDWQTVQRANLVEVSPPIAFGQPPRLNVLLVPDISQRSSFSSGSERDTGLLSLLRHTNQYSRILEFRYRVGEHFSWTRLADFGEVLLECLLESSERYQLRDCPLIVVSHGFGGCITKRAMSIISEKFYNHLLRGLIDTFQGLVFLGTPHPLYGKQGQVEKLDSLLSATLHLSRGMLAKIREEVGFMWNMSSKFGEIIFERPVISAYELRPTNFKTGLLRNKQEILVDKLFATTGMNNETMVGVDADHRNATNLLPRTQIYKSIKKMLQEALDVAESRVPRIDKLQIAQGAPVESLYHIWDSTPAASRMDAAEAQRNVSMDSGLQSPGGATTGSTNLLSGYEVVPVKKGPVVETPTVKLPCYLMRQFWRAGDCFGRTRILDMLDSVLLPSRTNAHDQLDDVRSFAICGLGGLGKTQIAIEFALTRKSHFDAIFFVYADSEIKLAESFNTIAEELGLADKTQHDNSAVNRDRVIEWLNSPLKHARNSRNEDVPLSAGSYANYLLVFDNADEPELLSEYWPLAGTGSILVTSRDPLTKSRIYSKNGIDLEPLSHADAGNLLQSLTGYEGLQDKDNALEIAERLEGLPLALQQVAGLIQRKNLSFREFLSLYQETAFQHDVMQFQARGFRSNYERMLFDVWTFENLKSEAFCLLEFCALLDPDRIPEFIFFADGKVLVENFASTPLGFSDARTDLFKSSLIKRLDSGEMLSVHRVLQDAVRVRMSDAHFCKVFLSVLNLIIASWPIHTLAFGFEPELWTTYGKLLPHIDHLFKLLSQVNPFENNPEDAGRFGDLLIKAGWYQYERGNYDESATIFEKAQVICTPFPEALARNLSDLDYCLSNIASFRKDWEGKTLYTKRNLEYRLANPGSAFDIGMAYNEMAYYYNDVGMYREAIDAGRKCVEEYGVMEIYRKNEQMAINPRLHIANAHYFLGEPDEAAEVMEPCLERLESAKDQWDSNPHRTGNVLYVLGNIRRAQGRHDESFVLHRRSMKQYKDTLGNLHTHTLKTYVKVADHYTRLQEYELAMKYLDNALAGWGDVYYFAPEKARALHKKSQILLLEKQALKAEGMKLNAERTFKEWYGPRNNGADAPAVIDYDEHVAFWAR